MCSRSSRGATCPSRSPRPRLDRKRSSLASAHWRGPDSLHACRATKSSTFRPPRRTRVSVMVQFGYRTSQLPMQTQMRTMWKNRTPRHPIVARTSWTTRKRHIHVHSHRRRRRCTANGVGSFQSSIDNERYCIFDISDTVPRRCTIPSSDYTPVSCSHTITYEYNVILPAPT